MRALPLCLVLVACGDKGADTASSEPATFAEVQTTLDQSCAFSGCHGGGAGGLTLDGDDYDALIDVESTVVAGEILVVPGSADDSYLIAKMEAAAGITGDPMPPSDLLDSATLTAIRAWIDAGAPNN